jgi:TolB-like protein
MAMVFLAIDERHQRPVALKVMRPELSAGLGVERFLREIGTAAALQHPHILPVYDSGAAGDFLYYVMPKVEGGSLRDRLSREHRLSVADAARIALDAGAALDFAHARGVVHRDIKPENLMYHEGVVVVTDFGIAKAATDADVQRLTHTGLVVGTPVYMSPEQSAGDPLDGRSDQYSLASVIFESLVGEPPFSAPTIMALFARRLTESVTPPGQLRPDLPEEVGEALLRALALEPSGRFPSVGAFAAALAGGGARGSRAVRVEPVREATAVAVLPFASRSGDAENEYLSDGVTEEIISVLSRTTPLRVAARTSAFAFKGKEVDIRTIGRSLGVTHILEGSVRRSGSRVRIAAQLISVADGYTLWSESYDREMQDVFALQDDIAKAVAAALQVTLLHHSGQMASDRGSRLPEAYALYLKGRFHANRRTETALVRAGECFRQALDRDPSYALAFAGLAEACALRGVYGAAAPDLTMPQAREAAQEALARNPTLAEAHTVVGAVRSAYDWDWAGAEAAFRTAIEHAPQYPTAHHWLATMVLLPQRRFDEAAERLAHAQALDPLSTPIGVSRGLQHYFARDHDAAVSRYLEVLDIDPHFAMARYFLGQAYEQQGRHAEAVAALRQAIAESGGSQEMTAVLARTLASAGARGEAEALLADLMAQAERQYVAPSLVAQVFAGLGRDADALDWLERAADVRAADLIWLGVRPDFDAVRSHPRFTAILQRLGLS